MKLFNLIMGCEHNGVWEVFVCGFFNGFSIVATLLHFVVSIKPPRVVSCYCFKYRFPWKQLGYSSFGFAFFPPHFLKRL